MEVVSEGYGEGSIGVSGQANKASSYRVRIPLLSVGATKFRNVTTSTNNHPYTLLGVKLLQYGKVTIDYPRGRFYFEAFQPDNEINNQGNNFDLTVKDGDLYVSTVWSSTKGKIAVGDKVIKINGKPAKKYDFCESILNGIPELKEKKKTKLTIKTASGVKDIIYEKNNMKRIGILTGLWLLLFLNCGQRMAAQIRNKVCDTIPYEFIQEKIIIPVTVNGIK